MDEFKKEEKEIHELKGVEKRINYFKFNLDEDRFKNIIDREMKFSGIKIIDKKFNCKYFFIFYNNFF